MCVTDKTQIADFPFTVDRHENVFLIVSLVRSNFQFRIRIFVYMPHTQWALHSNEKSVSMPNTNGRIETEKEKDQSNGKGIWVKKNNERDGTHE